MNQQLKDYFYKVSQGIAAAIVVTLGIGLLLQNLGALLQIDFLIPIGNVAKLLMIPALGAGIAYYLRVNILTALSAMVTGVIGGQAYLLNDAGTFTLTNGEPIGALVAIILTIEVGSFLFGKTPFDMMLVPLFSIAIGGGFGYLLSQPIQNGLQISAHFITEATSGFPLLSTVVIGLLFTFLILSPASSAALAIALQLEGSAAAAALIGCSMPFIVFAVLSRHENDAGTFFAQCLITPKLQTGNLIQKPTLVLIPMLFTVLLAPFGVLVCQLEASSQIAGMGLCALVAPLEILRIQGGASLLQYLLVVLVIPGIGCALLKPLLFKLGWLQPGDLKIKLEVDR
ncbi:PTS sugar transporter subunit IIC [Isobaculum melis]|uniref:Phosphotransferase system EIIC domain-containing protein n=1 Tax=Isobaculum melis TaxID=142588 RepID=A0A1H9SVK7_9LACT|nr:PTS sugar transporter subunit IIC [Isobaculum melis]SER88423.1 hypothetical protein SAMN04488559_10943 [Isobaculum melis]